MKLAIMQPYIFPYIGYFQLINSVDKFVIYDDVNFIKQGWIHRNNILVQGRPFLYTVPLNNQSSFVKINEVILNKRIYDSWFAKFLKTLEQAYKKAPFFSETIELIKNVFTINSLNDVTISSLSAKSLFETCTYLGVECQFVSTASNYDNNILFGKERVIDICKIEKAGHYINPPGGQHLYDKEYFIEQGIKLSFIKSLPIQYQQFNKEFVSSLSIIDVMMFNSPQTINKFLCQYELF